MIKNEILRPASNHGWISCAGHSAIKDYYEPEKSASFLEQKLNLILINNTTLSVFLIFFITYYIIHCVITKAFTLFKTYIITVCKTLV